MTQRRATGCCCPQPASGALHGCLHPRPPRLESDRPAPEAPAGWCAAQSRLHALMPRAPAAAPTLTGCRGEQHSSDCKMLPTLAEGELERLVAVARGVKLGAVGQSAHIVHCGAGPVGAGGWKGASARAASDVHAAGRLSSSLPGHVGHHSHGSSTWSTHKHAQVTLSARATGAAKMLSVRAAAGEAASPRPTLRDAALLWPSRHPKALHSSTQQRRK